MMGKPMLVGDLYLAALNRPTPQQLVLNMPLGFLKSLLIHKCVWQSTSHTTSDLTQWHTL